MRYIDMLFVAGYLTGTAICQTQLDLRTQSKNIDFTSAVATKPVKAGTTLPAICSTAEIFFNYNALPGQNLYICTSLNTWTLAGNGGGGGGTTGIASLNGLGSSTQTFVNDTNVTIVSGGTAHVIRWSGALAKARQHAATVYTDQANTYAGAFVQDFSAISHLRLPVAVGYSPTATGNLGYDSAANVYKGFNGNAVKTFAFLDSSITGNAATATAFANAPAGCPAGKYPLGIDAFGNAQNCTAASGTGDSAAITNVPFSPTPTFAFTKNSFEAQRLVLTSNVTASSLTVAAGTPFLQLSLCQDGTGGHTSVWPLNINGAPVISSTANSCTNVAGPWDGSTLNVSFRSVTNSSATPAFVYQINGNTYTQTLSANNGVVARLADLTDVNLNTSDLTAGNVSISQHGFAPKAPNDSTRYLDGTGNYSVPAGTGGSGFNASDRTSLYYRENFAGNGGGGGSFLYFARASNTGNIVEGRSTGGDFNHPLGVLFGSGAATNNDAALYMNFNDANPALFSGLGAAGTGSWEFLADVKLPQVVSQGFKMCLASNALDTADIVADGYCWRFSTNATDTTWKALACKGAVCTSIDSTVSVLPNTWYTLRIYSSASGIIRYDVTPAAGSVTMLSITGANVATADLVPGFIERSYNSAASLVAIAAPVIFSIKGMTRP